MKTKVHQKLLADAMKMMRGLISKEKLSAFSFVRLDAASFYVSLAGGNDMIQLTFRLKGDHREEGVVMVPGHYFDRFIQVMDGEVSIEGDFGSAVSISDARCKFNVGAANDDAYVALLGPKEDATSFICDARIFREMLLKVKFAAAVDSPRKILEGVCFEVRGDRLTMTATDGRRLAHVEKEEDTVLDDDKEVVSVVLPNVTVNTLYTLLQEEEKNIHIFVDDRSVRFVADKWTMVSKVYADKYPNWKAVVPENTAHRATIDREKFIDALKAACLAIPSGVERAVKISFKNGEIVFKTQGENTVGEIKIGACNMPKDVKFTVLLSPDLILDALQSLYDDEFTLEWNDSVSPIVLKCSIPWLTVIMPMRTK
jgi:DNA polymerase-3 subunit beta